jgi:hypothetical protein
MEGLNESHSGIPRQDSIHFSQKFGGSGCFLGMIKSLKGLVNFREDFNILKRKEHSPDF